MDDTIVALLILGCFVCTIIANIIVLIQVIKGDSENLPYILLVDALWVGGYLLFRKINE